MKMPLVTYAAFSVSHIFFFCQCDRFQVCDESRNSAHLLSGYSRAVGPGYGVIQGQLEPQGKRRPIHPPRQSSHLFSI